MTGFWDWLGRVIMLVLAGMITLSIIGAIAAIPSGSLPRQVRFEPESWPVPGPREERLPPAPVERRAEPVPAPATNMERRSQPVAVATAPEPAVEPTDWLETIAYALLALVGLATLAVLLLWRALLQWRRSADALEALAARQR